MDLYSKAEEIFGVSFDKLPVEERKVLEQWQKTISNSQLTIERIKEYVKQMKNAVASELVKTPEFDRWLFFQFPNRKHIFLKARLENLLLLEKVLFRKENLEKSIELYLESLKRR